MTMILIPKFPRKMEELLGPDGREEFIDFLNDSFAHQEAGVMESVSDRFDKKVTEEIARVNEAILTLDTRVNASIMELDNRIGEKIGHLDNWLSGEISGLRMDMFEMRADLKSEITSQTKWIVTMILAGTILYPLVDKLINRLL